MAKAIRFYGKDTQFFKSDGTVNSGGFLFQYQAGTTTKVDTYTDSGKGTSNDNPMVLNSAGRLAQDVYIDQSMKFVLSPSTDSDPPTAAIWTIDNIVEIEQLWQTVSKSVDYTTLETDNHKLITVDASGASRTITLLASATAGAGYMQAVKKVDSSANTVTIDPNSSETIDTGHTTYVLRNQNDTIIFISDGTNWQVLGLFFGESIQDGASVFTFSKGITITAGDLTVTAGDLTLTSGDLTLTDGDLTVTNEDTRTTTVDYPLTITSTTSDTPAAGIGTGILIRAESEDENPSEFGALEFCATDVTAGSEDTYLDVLTRVAGAALTKVWRFLATGAFKGIFTHANTADRTYTMPDTDISQHVVQMVYATETAGASTTASIPADNTIPQITEGTSFATLAITPKSASNLLVVDFYIPTSASSASSKTVFALFRQGTANAVQVIGTGPSGATTSVPMPTAYLRHISVAGGTSEITFEVRFGNSNTAYALLDSGGNSLYSTADAAIFSVMEVSP
jgi:hypothetical protein